MKPERPLFPIYDIMEHWAAFAHGTPEVKCQHHALYLALVNLCKVKGGSNRFALSYQHGMEISGIGSRNTYTAALKELEGWGFVTYTPGANGTKPPILAVHFCASAEHLLSIYRASTSTSADTSTGHNKEVIRLRLEDNEKASRIAELEKELADLKAKVPTPKAVPAPQLSTDLQARLAGLTDTSGELCWDESILTKPDYFARIARKLVIGDVDLEHYRRAALVVAESENLHRGITGWESWVLIYFTNQLKRGALLVLNAQVDLSKPTPRNEWPEEGTDCTGKHIVLPNTGDASLNRMAAASYAPHYPNITIHHTRP